MLSISLNGTKNIRLQSGDLTCTSQRLPCFTLEPGVSFNSRGYCFRKSLTMRKKSHFTQRKYLNRKIAARRASKRTAEPQSTEKNDVLPGTVDLVMPVEKSKGSSTSIPLNPLIQKLRTHIKNVSNDDKRRKYKYETQAKSLVKNVLKPTLIPALGLSHPSISEHAVVPSAQPVHQESHQENAMAPPDVATKCTTFILPDISKSFSRKRPADETPACPRNQ